MDKKDMGPWAFLSPVKMDLEINVYSVKLVLLGDSLLLQKHIILLNWQMYNERKFNIYIYIE